MLDDEYILMLRFHRSSPAAISTSVETIATLWLSYYFSSKLWSTRTTPAHIDLWWKHFALTYLLV